MCIVIDINIIPCVFKEENKYHSQYKPVLDWINKNRKVKIVYGGKKYKKELEKMPKMLRIFKHYKDNRQFFEINEGLIDGYEDILKKCCNNRKFDDKHIVSILVISGCRLVCSDDKEAHINFLGTKQRDFVF